MAAPGPSLDYIAEDGRSVVYVENDNFLQVAGWVC